MTVKVNLTLIGGENACNSTKQGGFAPQQPAMQGWVCQFCGATNDGGAFCQSCGAQKA